MRNGVVSPRVSSAPPTSATGYGFSGDPGKPLTEEERLDLFAQIDVQSTCNHVKLPAKTFEYWPTPTYSDAKNYGTPSQLKRKYIPLSCRVRMYRSYSGASTIFMRGEPGRTNPVFVEWLMGQPLRWNSLEPLETRSFLSWLHAHSSILRHAFRKCDILSEKEERTCHQGK